MKRQLAPPYAELIRHAYRYARYNRFLASNVAYRRRKVYVTSRQARCVPSTISRADWTSEGE